MLAPNVTRREMARGNRHQHTLVMIDEGFGEIWGSKELRVSGPEAGIYHYPPLQGLSR